MIISFYQLQGGEISHFRLEQLNGYGGMGAVYLATRNDGQLNQKVAIKLFYSIHCTITWTKTCFTRSAISCQIITSQYS